MKAVLLWCAGCSAPILFSLVIDGSKGMLITGILIAMSLGLIWNICRVKKG